MDTEAFISARFIGNRFENHSIPLEFLKELSVLEELIIEAAKWEFLKSHTDRKRVPKGFAQAITFKLIGIEEGSAVLPISLETASSDLIPSYFEYFEAARSALMNSIDAAENGADITRFLNSSLLTYFDRFGRGLEDNEAVELSIPGTSESSKITKAIRKKLLLASPKKWFTEEIIIRGTIPELDQDEMTFTIQNYRGDKYFSELPEQHFDTLMNAFNGYKDRVKVALEGIGRFSRNNRMLKIESVDHVRILHPQDISARLDEFRLLKNGWLDGHGRAPAVTDLDRISDFLEEQYPDSLVPPYLYPAETGGIRAEWTIGSWEISFDITVNNMTGEWHALNMKTNEEEARNLSLKDSDQWRWFLDRIRTADKEDCHLEHYA